MTFLDIGQVPIYYNHLSSGRPYQETDPYTMKYIDISNEPMYEFGYGLSYSKFKYSNLEITNKKQPK